jgi:UDP-N-acetylmuramyl-tripeptide synthetase
VILSHVLDGIYGKVLPEDFRFVDISEVWDDSRRVTPGSLFAAMAGATRKGDDFIDDAVARGARVVLLEQGGRARFSGKHPGVYFAEVSDPRAAFREIVEKIYGRPSRKVRVMGVTGTNGKTTITYFLESIIAVAGKRSGVVGTVNSRVGGKVVPSKNTTPGFLDNQIFLDGLVRAGVEYAVMEVSSHALAQGRVDQIDFCSGIFTNLTGDHLDFHGTMANYFEAKTRLFRSLAPQACAVINNDDDYGRRLSGLTRAWKISYGLKSPADVQAQIQSFDLAGTRFRVDFFGKSIDLKTHFIGYHNIYNILAAFAAGIGEGFSPEVLKRGIESLAFVPGRLERVDCAQPFAVFIDYAHTDDGLKNVLECLKEVPHKRLIVVFGCGGDRDRTKRPRMGRVASELADISILTSDNPRSEEPSAIIQEIVPGLTGKNYEIVVDRSEAIARALKLAQPNDIVLLAGKGHETYQVLKDRTIDFNERDIVTGILKGKGAVV